MTELIKTLDSIAELDDDWDGEGGLSLCPQVQELSVLLINRLADKYQLEIGIIPDGGLDLVISEPSISLAIHPEWYQMWRSTGGLDYQEWPREKGRFDDCDSIEDRFKMVMNSFDKIAN